MKVNDIPKKMISSILRIYKKDFLEIIKKNKISGKGVDDPMIIINKVRPLITCKRMNKNTHYDWIVKDEIVNNQISITMDGYIRLMI